MNGPKALIFVLIWILVSSFNCLAIVTGDINTSESNPSLKPEYSDFDWGFIYNYRNSSAVAVDPYWILTAAHVADDPGTGEINIGSTTYYQQGDPIYHETADLALVRFDKPFPGSYSIFMGELVPNNPNNRLSAIMVGYGNTGTVSSASWSDSGSGSGTKRWGSQIIDEAATVSYDSGGDTGVTTNSGFWMDFNAGDTDYEAGVGVYDSGGGTFVNDGGEWKLAGINTVRDGLVGAYTKTFSVSVQDYSEWINTAVPEPSMSIFLILAALAFWVRKRILRGI